MLLVETVEQPVGVGLEPAHHAGGVGRQDAGRDQQRPQVFDGLGLGQAVERGLVEPDPLLVQVGEQVTGSIEPSPGGEWFGCENGGAQRVQRPDAVGWDHLVEMTPQRARSQTLTASKRVSAVSVRWQSAQRLFARSRQHRHRSW
jgi:hypothetical protein